MTKEQALEILIEQINHNMETFIAIVSILLAVFVVFQWRLSNKQIEKMKKDTLDKIEGKHHLSKLEEVVSDNSKKIKELESQINELKDEVKVNKADETMDIDKLKETIKTQKQMEIQRGYTVITELDQMVDELKQNDTFWVMNHQQKIYRLIDELLVNKFLPNITKAPTLSIIYDKLYYVKDNNKKYAEELRNYLVEKAGDLIKAGQEFMNSPLRDKNNDK
ncbi:hypothetical protein [uncultured Limosilactobacillus sp.]|uniref:hypothetical protein n=1 Tax=uncultured Limosilactobacillus sp. TaxID=2837629 RepID=UPI0025E68520|nr:hypothetical protein [uncultured Limosilactobacillus sp.]